MPSWYCSFLALKISTALRPHIQKEISATFCPTSISGFVNLLLSGTTLKNARNLLAVIARFSGMSLFGILTLLHGFLSLSIPNSSSLKSLMAALYTSRIHTGYCSLQRLVSAKDSIHRLRKAEVKRENIIFSVSANLSMCLRAHL